MSWPDERLDRWTRIGVYQNLYADVRNWCGIHRVLISADVPEVLWPYLSYLDETGRLDPSSHPLGELRKPLRCYGGLGPDGLPASPTAPRIRCVCKVPYRRGPARGRSAAG